MARATKQSTAKKTNAAKPATKRTAAKSATPKATASAATNTTIKAKAKAPASRKSTTGKRSTSTVISRDDVAARAYQIWLEKGKPAGQDEVNWQQAEAELGFAA